MKRITLASTIVTLGMVCIIVFLIGGERASKEDIALKFFICGIVIVIGAIYFTQEFLKAEKIIFDIESLPLLETDEAVDGVPFAGEEIVEPENEKILKSPYTNTPCVYFHSIKEKYEKTEKYRGWVVVENIASFVPFFIKDERGKLKVDITNLDDDFSGYSISKRNVPDPKKTVR